MTHIRFAFLFVLISLAAMAQTFRGELAGTVTDPSGAALASAAVKLDNPATGFSRSALTNSTGAFVLAELPVGLYEMTVTSPGFEVKKFTGVEIAVAKTTNI